MHPEQQRIADDLNKRQREVAKIRDVGRIICELNDCGFDDAIELIDRLTKERDAAEFELSRCVRDPISAQVVLSK